MSLIARGLSAALGQQRSDVHVKGTGEMFLKIALHRKTCCTVDASVAQLPLAVRTSKSGHHLNEHLISHKRPFREKWPDARVRSPKTGAHSTAHHLLGNVLGFYSEQISGHHVVGTTFLQFEESHFQHHKFPPLLASCVCVSVLG